MKFTFLFAALAALAHGQITSFKHIVVIVQENRTPDNLFYALCATPRGTPDRCSTTPNASQYNIQTHNWVNKSSSTGVTQPAPVALANKYDLSHAHKAFTQMCDVNSSGICKMDGAADIACSGTCTGTNPQFRYVDNSKNVVTPYLTMATQYGWANYMFQTNQGPSFPAHQFLFGGTSAPSAADDAAGIFASENMSTTTPGGADGVAGCTAPSTTTVDLINPTSGESSKTYPCFEHQTMADILATFTWRYYAPSAGSIWTAPNSIQHICESTGPGGKCAGQAWTSNVDLTPSDVLKDIASCNLRSLSWVIPSGQNSDHANVNDGGGPSWVTAIVNAIGKSSACESSTGYWQDTAIILTWDDWGGWYDHEPPTILPQPGGDYQYGFRVPLVVISAYTPEGYIDNQRHDFGSVLRFIEHNFGITEGSLNFADARANNDLSPFFTLAKSPRRYRTINAPKSGSYFLHDKRKATDPDDQ